MTMENSWLRFPPIRMVCAALLTIPLLGGGCVAPAENEKWQALSDDTRPRLRIKKRATAQPLAETTRILSMEHRRTQQGDQLSLTADRALSHEIFRLTDPDRLVLRFPKTVLSPSVQPMVVDQSLVTGLFPSETQQGESLIEVVMSQPLEYRVDERSNGLELTILRQDQAPTEGKVILRDLQVSYTQEGTQLRLMGEGTVTSPHVFRLDNPPRLVIDMAGAQGPMPSHRFTINSLHATQAVMVGGEQKTRLMIELIDPTIDYRLTDDHGMPVILLGHHGAVTDPQTEAYEQGVSAQNGVYDVRFTREEEIGLVRIRLRNKGGSLKSRREDNQIILDLPNTPVASSLLRRMDVRAFGGPVRTVDTALHEGGAQVTVTLERPGSRHEVMEKEGEILLRVYPAPPKTTETSSPYVGKKVSLDFKDIDVQNALRIIAEISQLNIILSDSVQGTLTMRLVDVPWDQALALILEAKGLGQVQQGNVLRVAPLAEIQSTAQARLQAQQSARQLEPFITALVPVSFADAAALRTLLMEGDQQHGTRLVSAAGMVSLDTRTNTLIVKDTAENVARVREMVTKLDKPIPQVLIEARIVEVTRSSADEFGIKWGFNQQASSTLSFSDTAANAYTTHMNTGAVTKPRARLTGDVVPTNVNLQGITNPTGRLGIHLGALSPLLDLDIEIAALEQNNKAKTISSPRVLTTNNKKATISQGSNFPYNTESESGGTTISFVQANLSLAVTPQVTPNGFITLQIEATNDTISASGTGTTAPAIDTKAINTQALVQNGETIVLGGIFKNSETNNRSAVPGFAKLPLVGYLFQNHEDATSQTELLIFITPHIIQPKETSIHGG